ncbi:hypothetical protein BH18VER1_BH18VER1_04290 [soil metagenome]
MTRSYLPCAIAVLVLFVAASPSHAYGPIGHQIVGAIADERLAGTPAGAKVRRLLDGFTLEKAAVIADEIKGWDKNGADDPNIFHYSSRPRIDEQLRSFWRANPPTRDHDSPVPSHHWFHYADVPVLNGQKYADGKTGRWQWDIVHMISYCVAVLHGDEPEDNPRKIPKPIAIILLAHYLGDIHQPLHVGAQYFNAQGVPVDPDRGDSGIEAQGGNTIKLRHAPAGAARIGNSRSKLHGFWDTNAAMASMPYLPKDMPKEERRARTDAARRELVRRFAREEPKNWHFGDDVPLKNYAQAYADEILPIAREAHERLEFKNVRHQQDEDRMLAVGEAEERTPDDGVAYYDWAAEIVREQLHKGGWRLADLLHKALQ